MPEIPDREALERRVSAALRRLRGEQRTRLLAHLGSPPDPSRVPESFWREIEDDDRELLLLLLLPVAVASGERVAGALGLSMDRGRVESIVRQRIEDRVSSVSRDAAVRSKEILIGMADPRETVPQGLDLDSIFGDTRIETQAITEITQANSIGELSIVRDVDDPEAPVPQGDGTEKPTVFVTWKTERDASVCPVCRPLDGRPEPEWVDKFPDGPPAHPNCRCTLVVGATHLGRLK